MPGPPMLVSFDHLTAGEERVRRGLRGLREMLDRLEQDLDPVVSSWSGAARDAYVRARREWTQAQVDLLQVLGELAAVLRAAHGNHTHADAVNVGMWE